jgi:hypothetical protein
MRKLDRLNNILAVMRAHRRYRIGYLGMRDSNTQQQTHSDKQDAGDRLGFTDRTPTIILGCEFG